MNLGKRLKHIWMMPWFADSLSWLGGVLFTIQIWIYAHTQSSVLDEGAYLIKGYLYAIGRYFPYQNYGFWANHMPLSFLIPGYVQLLFGPGLKTARYFAIFLGVLMLVGVWLVAHRLGGRWWAAAAVGLLALNVQLIKVYSIMASQGLVACMLVWVLVLTLGEDRRLWQLLLGTALAALISLTRINMAPVLPFLIFYIFWEHGRKIGLWSLLVGALVFGGGHAVFWPGILKLWAYWLPAKLVPFLRPWAKPEGALPNWNPDTNILDRIQSFFQSVRLHFFAVMGASLSWFFWPKKDQWKSAWRFRAAGFLSALFVFLLLLHIIAALGGNYCVYCLNVYMAFFPVLGVLLVVVTLSSWQDIPDWGKGWLPAGLIIVVSMGVGYSLIPAWGNKLVTSRFVYRFMHIDVPRVKSFWIQPGSTELWGLFANKFGWAEQEIVDFAIDLLRTVSFLALGLLAGWLILRYGRKWGQSLIARVTGARISSGGGALISFLILGTLFTLVAGLAPYDRDCGWDVIASYEAGGKHLAEYVPSGTKVYWWGGLSAVPLLYISDVDIFPAQINNGYSFRLGGDPDELSRFGWWSQELADQWIREADVILIEARMYGGFATGFAEGEDFDEVSPTPPMVPCRNNSPIHIFIREQ